MVKYKDMRKELTFKGTEEIKCGKRSEEAEDHKDEYYEAKNAEYNLGAGGGAETVRGTLQRTRLKTFYETT